MGGANSLQVLAFFGCLLLLSGFSGKVKIAADTINLTDGQSPIDVVKSIRRETLNKWNSKVIDVKPFLVVDGEVKQLDLYNEVRELRKRLGLTTKVLDDALNNEEEYVKKHRKQLADYGKEIEAKLEELALLNIQKKAVEDDYEREKAEHYFTQRKHTETKLQLEKLHTLHNQIRQTLGDTEKKLEMTDASKERRGEVIKLNAGEKLELVGKLENLEAQFRKATKNNEELKHNVIEFHAKLSLAENTIEKDGKLRQFLQKTVDELKAEVKEVENQNGLHKDTINNLKELEKLLKAKLQKHKLTETQFREMNQHLENKLADLQRKNAALDALAEKQRDQLTKEVGDKSSLQSSLYETRENKARLEEEISSLRETTTQFRAENANLKEAKEAMIKDNHALDKEISKLKSKKKAYKEHTLQLKKDIDEHKGNRQELENELARRINENAELDKNIAELERLQAVQQERISNLTHNNMELSKDILGLKTDIKEINVTKKELEDEIDRLKLNIKEHEGNEKEHLKHIALLKEAEAKLQQTSDSLSAKVEELGVKVGEKDAKLAKKKLKTQKLKSQAATNAQEKERLEKDILKLKHEFENAIDENKKLDRRMNQFETDLKVANNSLTNEQDFKRKLEKELTHLAAEMERVRRENGEHQKTIQTLKKIEGSLTAQVEHHKLTEAEFEDLKNEMNNQLKQLDNEKASLTKSINELRLKKEGSKAEKEAIQKDLQAALVKQAELNSELKNVQSASSKLNEDNSHLEAAYQAMLSDSLALKTRISILEQESRDLNEKANVLDKDFSIQRNKNEELQRSAQGNLLAAEELRRTIVQMVSEKLALDVKLAKKSKKNGVLKENKAALMKQIAEMEIIRVNLEKEIDHLNENIQQNVGDKVVLNKKIEQLESARHSLQETKERLQDTIQVLEQNKVTLEGEKSELEQNNKQLENKLSIMDQEKRNLDAEVDKLRTLYESSTVDKTALNMQLAEVIIRLGNVSENHAQSAAYNRHLQEKLDELYVAVQKMERTNEEHKANIQNLENENKNLATKAAKNKQKKENLKKEQERLIANAEKLKEESRQAGVEAKKLRDLLAQESGDKRELVGRLENAEAHRLELAEKLREADSEATKFMVENKALEVELMARGKELEETIQLHRQDIAEKEETVKQLIEQVELHNGDKSELSKTVGERLEEIGHLQVIVADTQTQKIELDTRVEMLSGEREELIKDHNSLEIQVKKITETNELLESEIEKVDNEIKKHQGNEALLEQEQESLKETRKNLKLVLATLIETNDQLWNQNLSNVQQLAEEKRKISKQEAQRIINEQIEMLEQKRKSLMNLLNQGRYELEILRALHQTNEKEKRELEEKRKDEGYIVLEVANFLFRNKENLKKPEVAKQRKEEALRIMEKIKSLVNEIVDGDKSTKSYSTIFLQRLCAILNKIFGRASLTNKLNIAGEELLPKSKSIENHHLNTSISEVD